MNLIKEINSLTQSTTPILEDAGTVVTANSIAASPLPLISNIIKRPMSDTSPKVINFGSKRYKPKSKNKLSDFNLKSLFKVVESLGPDKGTEGVDTTGIISKLKNLENKESVDYRDTVTFGLVDSNDGTVKVTVPRDQSAGFEQDLHHFLGAYSESDPSPEIAEVLFKLKNNYHIINVEWPESMEDAEESSEYDPKNPKSEEGDEFPSEEGGEGDEFPGEEGGELDQSAPMDTGSTDKVTDLLTQVIDMMKADADARKSEAQAREAEAKTHQAKAAREQAMARVKQEEQFLDMDSYQKNQKEKDKEAKRLAQLAKWKHDLANDKENTRPAQEPQYDFLPGDENEEYAKLGRRYRHIEDEEYTSRSHTPTKLQPQQSNKVVRGKVHPSDIAKFIMSRVKP